MPTSIGDWIAHLQTKDLPVLNRSVLEMNIPARRYETLTAGDIAARVYSDPLLTFRVLRMVNSLPRSHLASEITTVEHAVLMMGIGPFFDRVGVLSTVDDELAAAPEILDALRRVLSRAHHAAVQAFDYAILRQDVRAEEVYVAALLMHLGEVAVLCCSPDRALELARAVRVQPEAAAEMEQRILGFRIVDLQAALAGAWGFPEMYAAFAEPEGHHRARALTVTLATAIARESEAGWGGERLSSSVEELASVLHIHVEDAFVRVHRNAVTAAREWERFGVRPAAAWLPMEPGEWPAAPTPQPVDTVCPMPHPDRTQAVMAEIGGHLDGSFTLDDLMKRVLHGMHEGVGLSRIVFALLSPSRTELVAKYVIGAGADSPLRAFRIGLEGEHLFSRLMGKMQAVWHNAANHEKLVPLLPQSVTDVVGQGHFYAMSVFVQGKPVGLFYADRGQGACELDEHSFESFKRLVLRASEGLAHLSST
ncbi:MAG: HDOD domain-containing protein [Betaproteobacteria bacterium]|nr:HDOD domain-containing protein [Betaproteobacteria bacterium]